MSAFMGYNKHLIFTIKKGNISLEYFQGRIEISEKLI